jgi:hypothetical protein
MVLRQAELSQKLPFPSPEFVLTHTFSHLFNESNCVLNQAMECHQLERKFT